MEKLAREGVILDSSYVQHVCTPSRAAFLTGYYPFHLGLQHDVIRLLQPSFLPNQFPLLPEKLQRLGYSTHIVGKWHLGFCDWNHTPTRRGFDSFYGFYSGYEDYYSRMQGDGYDFRFNESVWFPPEGEYSTNIFARRAVDIIESNNPQQTPLFLYLPFQSVHSPIQVPPKYEDMYLDIEDLSRRRYSGMVTAMDDAIGQVTRALEDNGYMDNLIIVFTTDNGGSQVYGANNLPLRGAKTTLWEGGTRGISFVYSKTLLEEKGYVNKNMFHIVDWHPTLLAAIGAEEEIDPEIDGINQWPTISQNAPTNRTEFVYNIDDRRRNAAIRVGDYKLIEGVPGIYNTWYGLAHESTSPDVEVQTNELNSEKSLKSGNKTAPDKPKPKPKPKPEDKERISFMEKTKKILQLVLKPQLFNLQDDPEERVNLANDRPDLVRQLQRRLDKYRKSMVRSFDPPDDHSGLPRHFNDIWSPGWC
ncbi:hypothetical protein ScPMuIL_013770 [Solemya velum]